MDNKNNFGRLGSGDVGQVGREVYKLRCGGKVELIERTVFKRLKPM